MPQLRAAWKRRDTVGMVPDIIGRCLLSECWPGMWPTTRTSSSPISKSTPFCWIVGCGDGARPDWGLAAHVRRVPVLDHGPDARRRSSTVRRERRSPTSISFPAAYTRWTCPTTALAPAWATRYSKRWSAPTPRCGKWCGSCAPAEYLVWRCVEYGGLILAGPGYPLIRRFYDIRERLWLDVAGADPYLGRRLRGLLHAAGLSNVEATTKHICYGTSSGDAPVSGGQSGGLPRRVVRGAGAIERGLATQDELNAMESAWRVVGRRGRLRLLRVVSRDRPQTASAGGYQPRHLKRFRPPQVLADSTRREHRHLGPDACAQDGGQGRTPRENAELRSVRAW